VFKDLATKPTNQIFTNKENKILSNLANACYLAFQNFLSFRFLSNNITVKIRGTITLRAALYGCKTWSVTLGTNMGWGCWKMGC